jgi:hypothetical protein
MALARETTRADEFTYETPLKTTPYQKSSVYDRPMGTTDDQETARRFLYATQTPAKPQAESRSIGEGDQTRDTFFGRSLPPVPEPRQVNLTIMINP